MPSDSSPLLSIIQRFEQNPDIQALRSRYDFEACVVIETNEMRDFYSARNYAFSSAMKGRVRPERKTANELVSWFFEYPDDGILFALKFGTPLPRKVS